MVRVIAGRFAVRVYGTWKSSRVERSEVMTMASGPAWLTDAEQQLIDGSRDGVAVFLEPAWRRFALRVLIAVLQAAVILTALVRCTPDAVPVDAWCATCGEMVEPR